MHSAKTICTAVVFTLSFLFVNLLEAQTNTSPASGNDAGARRDILFNAGWHFFRNDMRAGKAVAQWQWKMAEEGQKARDLAKGPVPDEHAAGWQPYTAGQPVSNNQAGVIWFRATLPGSAGPHRSLHLSSAVKDDPKIAVADGQLDDGVGIEDRAADVFLNGKLLASPVGGNFDVDLDQHWTENGPNVITLLIETKKPSTVPLGSVSLIDSGDETEFRADYDDHAWPVVSLPHWDRLESYNTSRPYQGLAWYRKILTPGPELSGKRVTLEFEGAMQVADVWVNGEHRVTHYGGYLPFTIDLSNDVKAGAPVTIAVKVDSRDNNLVPPGKPIGVLDFEYYNGIYRNAWLHVTAPVHITDAIVANKPAGGGILVSYPAVSASSATVQIQTEVANETPVSHSPQVTTSLINAAGQEVAASQSGPQQIGPKSSFPFVQKLQVKNPLLWHPDHPNLYRLRVIVSEGTQPMDEQTIRVGIRTIAIDREKGFLLNGEKLMLSGANRHQYYPWIGGALSDEAQYRDLWKLKNAGWNFVRLAHYPQSPAAMDACDELGLLAIVCNPGWQYWKEDPVFWNRMEQDMREMVRWHRNHPSSVFWEVTINEAYAPKVEVNQWHKAVHEELPGNQTFTSGDTREYARVKGKIVTADPPGLQLDVPYPSWEHKEATPADANSRKRIVREYGAIRDQLADGNGEADTILLAGAKERLAQFSYWLSQPSTCALSLWSYMDYMRGNSRVNSGRGTVDIARLPKFSYFAYQSQRDPKLIRKDIESGPMAFIANYWMPASPHDLVVFSNCDQIELFVNGKSLARQSPDKLGIPHPAFTFPGVAYAPGQLKAVGYIGGQPVVTTVRKTPETPTHLKLIVDDAGRPLLADGADCVFVRAQVLDDNGTVVPDAKTTVQFQAQGDVQIVSERSRPAIAGVASTLIRAGLQPGSISLSATANGLTPSTITVNSIPSNR